MKHLLQESSNHDESHNPALPDKTKPWCPNCRLHAEWYAVYKTHTTGGRVSTNRSLACKGCDGLMCCPAGPVKRWLIAITSVLVCVVLGAALATNGFCVGDAPAAEDELMGSLVCFAAAFLMVYVVRSISKDVRKHWEEFHKWADEQGHH